MSATYILEAIRAPRGKGRESGSLHSIKPIDVLKQLFEEMQVRASAAPNLVDEVILGCVTPVADQGGNIAHAAALYANWQTKSHGTTINSFCTSGLTACSIAAAKIHASMGELYAVGGIEAMSRVPMMSDKGAVFIDPVVSEYIPFIPNGVIADFIATKEGFSRRMLDEFAVASHHKAALATEKGYFKRSLVPIRNSAGDIVLSTDENIRSSTSVEALSNLEPAFIKLGEKGFNARLQKHYPNVSPIIHAHHSGNSPGMVDGASLALLGSLDMADKIGLKARAKIKAVATSRVPAIEGLTGAIAATQQVLNQAGMAASDIELWESNEGFAAVVMNYAQTFNIPAEKLNVNGGGIAMGHAMGATGVNLLGTIIDELERRNLQTGLIAISGAVGIGAAMIVERVG